MDASLPQEAGSWMDLLLSLFLRIFFGGKFDFAEGLAAPLSRKVEAK